MDLITVGTILIMIAIFMCICALIWILLQERMYSLMFVLIIIVLYIVGLGLAAIGGA